jgi:hypothetical protein
MPEADYVDTFLDPLKGLKTESFVDQNGWDNRNDVPAHNEEDELEELADGLRSRYAEMVRYKEVTRKGLSIFVVDRASGKLF